MCSYRNRLVNLQQIYAQFDDFQNLLIMKYVNYSKKHFFLLLILQLDVAVFSFESFKLILKFVSFFFKVENGFLNQHLGHFFFFGPLKGWFQIKSHLLSMSFLQIYIFCVFFRCLPIQVRQQPICFQYWRDWFTDHNSLPWQECSF